MKRRDFMQLAAASGVAAVSGSSLAGEPRRPNLLIVHTDEHNFRTLGCYREQLSDDQAFVWGKGVKVDTSHIDSLAHEGALCTSYYAASPVCTPSRASFISGLYPQATGSPKNNLPLNDDLVSFAEVLKRNGYATAYVGKWHLDGDAKPGWAPKRKFGFDDNRYMFNRGHWKLFEETAEGPRVKARDRRGKPGYGIEGADKASFATDFLVDRTLEIIERDKAKPFCVMLSLPDPHGPNTVRAPYDSMFTHLKFEKPRTMLATPEQTPRWCVAKGKNAVAGLKQHSMAQYFGMVRCIDDNVGKMLAYLKAQGLDRDTIVVFTADHGDLMGEHRRHNKGLPYETSAGIPFVIRYPAKIGRGKVLHTAYTTADFAPTILSIMGLAGKLPGCHGRDTSADFLGPEAKVRSDRVVYLRNSGGRWVAAIDSRYKLVVSTVDKPWLFDLEKDPDELTNFHDAPEYAPVVERLKTELLAQMKRYKEPALEAGSLILDSDTPIPPATEGRKRGKGAARRTGAVLKPESGGEYMIDAQDLSRDATKSKPSAWSRALTVPSGSFGSNASYELSIEWESKGLAESAEFYANFITGRGAKRKKQLATWKGAAGKTGTVTKTLTTDASDQWLLAVGVKGSGHLVVKRIRIRRQ